MDDVKSLSHSKWRCQYHIVFAPKYRRQEIYGKLKAGDFANLDAVCTRAEAAYIFAHALPAKELAAKNTVSTLPDVATGDKYASEIFLLYRAGVLGGNDDIGTFGADGAFNRAQAAAVIYRLCIPGARQTLSF